MCSGRVINMSPGRGESWREYMWNEIFMWQWCEQFSEITYHSKHKEPQAPLEENKYGKYHIILSEAGCEG